MLGVKLPPSLWNVNALKEPLNVVYRCRRTVIKSYLTVKILTEILETLDLPLNKNSYRMNQDSTG